jgi:hypothetical protein
VGVNCNVHLISDMVFKEKNNYFIPIKQNFKDDNIDNK